MKRRCHNLGLYAESISISIAIVMYRCLIIPLNISFVNKINSLTLHAHSKVSDELDIFFEALFYMKKLILWPDLNPY